MSPQAQLRKSAGAVRGSGPLSAATGERPVWCAVRGPRADIPGTFRARSARAASPLRSLPGDAPFTGLQGRAVQRAAVPCAWPFTGGRRSCRGERQLARAPGHRSCPCGRSAVRFEPAVTSNAARCRAKRRSMFSARIVRVWCRHCDGASRQPGRATGSGPGSHRSGPAVPPGVPPRPTDGPPQPDHGQVSRCCIPDGARNADTGRAGAFLFDVTPRDGRRGSRKSLAKSVSCLCEARGAGGGDALIWLRAIAHQAQETIDKCRVKSL